ncbi:hypothetical protein [Paenibacillus methanolicus]|uniref:Uncharacterized protein n=1 Tax=Paenibacillus methanolicus TaxID=582686 RepID=A0A5S5CMB6_9BACL|nr:hypothetical protein [Paenibacillus methanolicus]TYP79528.1 hypothetical protein BCM02_101646 [Paenibacillus methanolicus]
MEKKDMNVSVLLDKAAEHTSLLSEITETKAAGTWRNDRRFKADYEEMTKLAEILRGHDDENVSMYGFRMQMLIGEFVETDIVCHDKVVHLREVRNQEELLQLAAYRAVEAYRILAEENAAEQQLRQSI